MSSPKSDMEGSDWILFFNFGFTPVLFVGYLCFSCFRSFFGAVALNLPTEITGGFPGKRDS